MGDIAVQGNNFPLVNTKEYQISISPKLLLQLSTVNLGCSGSILIPSAQIRPETFTNSLTLSDDVIFKKQTTDHNQRMKTSMDIRVVMGDAVELTFKGLHAFLDGAVQVRQVLSGPVNATGELTVKKGEYKAYGQDLEVEQGQLMFTGGPLTNPAINLRASKKIDNNASVYSGSDQAL